MNSPLSVPRGRGLELASGSLAIAERSQAAASSGPGDSSAVRRAPADAGELPASLRGATRSAGPRLQRYDWAERLEGATDSSARSNLLREARAGTLQPLPVGGKVFARFAGNKQVRDDVRVLGFTIWRRDGRYKEVLRQATELGDRYQAKPGATADERRGQLGALRGALADFDQALHRYQQRASPARRDLMAQLSEQTRIEIALLERVESDLSSGDQTLSAPASIETLGELLGYTRAGLAPDDALNAHRLGIDRQLAASALQVDWAVKKALPLSTLALLIRHQDLEGRGYSRERDDSQRQEDVRQLTNLHVVGWSDHEIDQALTLNLPLETIHQNRRDASFRASIQPRLAMLEALAQAQSPGQDLLDFSTSERTALNTAADGYRMADIPPEWAGPAWAADISATDLRGLMDTGIDLESFKAALAADLPKSHLLSMAGDPARLREITSLMSLLGEGLDEAQKHQAGLPDAAALDELCSQPASGRPLSRAEAWALQSSGLPERSLPIEDLVGLIELGVSAAGIVALGKSPPEPRLVQSILELGGGHEPAFSRAQALLLAGAGWPADRDTLALFNARYDNGQAIVPVNEQTVRRDLGRGRPEAPKTALGAGQFNEVFALQLVDPGSGKPRPAVFKPLQRIHPDNTPAALRPTGISQGSPRFELRNLAHSQLDALLGFGVVPGCELTVVDGQAGLLMERAEGQTAARVGKWDPPVDITDSNLGFQLLELLRQAPPVGQDTVKAYAARERVAIEIRETPDGPQILLTEGVYVPRIDPASAGAQRSLIGLQWLHAITGATDGHDRNIIRSDDGQRFIGIDNDLSFGSKTRHPDELKTRLEASRDQPFHGKGLPPIADQFQYDAIKGLTAERVRAAIGRLISPAELQATLARLTAVQAHLDSLKQQGNVIAADTWNEQSYQTIREAFDENGPSYLHRMALRHDLLGVDVP